MGTRKRMPMQNYCGVPLHYFFKISLTHEINSGEVSGGGGEIRWIEGKGHIGGGGDITR